MNIVKDKVCVKPKLKTNTTLRDVWKYRQILLMLVPALLYFLIFRYGPIFGVIIAFQDYSPKVGMSFMESIFASEWVGLQHFRDFFSSLNAVQILTNTVVISLYKIAFGFSAPIILALLLNEVNHKAFKKSIQTITYLPHFISWVILAGVLRILFSPDNGLIVPIFQSLNMDVVNILGDPRYFRGLLVISDIWQGAGWGSIIYLAALSGIDSQLYEAAKIDGAGKFKQLIYITLPSISSTIVTMLILRTGSILNAGFDQVFNLYNPAVYSVGDIIDTYVYRVGLEKSSFSYSTAIGLFKSVIGFVLVMFTNYTAKRLGEEGIN